MFADDTQSYSYCQISETPLLVARLSSCIDYLAKSYVRFITVTTQPIKDRVYLVRLTHQSAENEHPAPDHSRSVTQ